MQVYITFCRTSEHPRTHFSLYEVGRVGKVGLVGVSMGLVGCRVFHLLLINFWKTLADQQSIPWSGPPPFHSLPN